ncbi:TPA: hypothetical protein ACN35C_004743 [Vibrio parahaemolyticus]
MKFNYEGNTYNIRMVAGHISDESYEDKEYSHDGEGKCLTKHEEHFLYFAELREEKAGLVIYGHKGIVVDHLRKDWHFDDEDIVEDFDGEPKYERYQEDESFDNEEFEELFRVKATEFLENHCRQKIAHNKFENISEALKVDTGNVADILEDVKSRKQEGAAKVEEPKHRSSKKNKLR